jgi:hypothetical protein
MARTPEQWLDVLAKRLDERAPYVALMRRYRNGDAPLPEMSRNLRPSWEAFQRKSRANWGGFAVDARADRIVYAGVTVGGSVSSDEALAAARIARDNRLEVAFARAVNDCLSTGYGYVIVGRDDEGRAVVTAEPPEQVIVAQDPIQSWRARVGLKGWRDADEGFDYASVWVLADGVRYLFRRPSVQSGVVLRTWSGGGWERVDSKPFSGVLPVFELEAETGTTSVPGVSWAGGLAMLDGHTDLIDRINHGVLFRLVTMAMQAFRQRALKMRDGMSLPEMDEAGNVVDYTKVFEPAPGALWELPAEVEDLWESQQVSAADLLNAVKDDLRTFGTATSTPMPGVASDGQNQSAEGARSGKEGLSAKASQFVRRVRPVLNGAIVAALRVEGWPADDTVEVKFEPTDRVTLAEKMDAASKAIAAGMSLAVVQRDILGWSPEQIEEDAKNRRRDASRSAMADLLAARNQPQAVTGGGVGG